MFFCVMLLINKTLTINLIIIAFAGLERSCAHQLLIYNLFGSVEEVNSIILSHDDLFSFIFHIIGDSEGFTHGYSGFKPFGLFGGVSKIKYKAMSYTQLLYQIVFSTKFREPSLHESRQRDLYAYIYGLLKNKNCHIYRIGGVEDHLHIVTHIHPTIAIANLVKDIKLASSDWIKRNNIFEDFAGWQDGYGAFTYGITAKNNLIEYVKNQKEHHKNIDFIDEFKKLLMEHQVEFDEKHLL